MFVLGWVGYVELCRRVISGCSLGMDVEVGLGLDIECRFELEC